MRYILCSLAVLSSLPAQPTHAQSPATPNGVELAQAFRSIIVAGIPDPLVEQSFNWGHQEWVPVGLKWEKNGLLLKPTLQKKLHNDGVWRRISVTADHPETLDVQVGDVRVPESGKLRFGIKLTLPARLRFEQQFWHAGTRLYSGETRARCHVSLALSCESTTRFERKPGALLPDVLYRLRVIEARLSYRDLVVEHTAGIGGDAARLLGEAAHETVKQWKPSLERKLLDRANAAIIKAGDTKEVRLGLSKLLEAK